MKHLLGITWTHPRGYESIEAVTKAYCLQHEDLKIKWDRQSMKDFADYPVTSLAEKYDLIMMDHPHIGSAVKHKALLPLDELLPKEYMDDQRKNSVGRSCESYCRDGHQWALAVDAASHVSCFRKDLMEHLGKQVPRTWQEVLNLASELPLGYRVGIPLCPTDIYCSFLSVCANLGGDGFFNESNGIDRASAEEATGLLWSLAPRLYPDSARLNPIQMLDIMAETDQIVYIPLTFGYSNYSRPGKGKHPIDFTNIPSAVGEPSGALLGGVGLAISSRCREKEAAVGFVKYAASAEIQKTVYYQNAGQPGHREAWVSREVNNSCRSFFLNTLETLDRSYLRPQYDGYNLFQEAAGAWLNDSLLRGKTVTETVDGIAALFREKRNGS